MPSSNNRQPAGGALVITGLTIIALGLVFVPHPGEIESIHTIERTVGVDEVPETKTVTPVDELSPEAKSAFRDTLANDGSHTVYGEENRAPEWRYTDDVGYYYVRSEETIYEITTSGSSSQSFDYVKISPFLLIGLVMSSAGVRWLRGG
jgi:hypothetical protein